MTATLCACQCIWLSRLLEQIGLKNETEVKIKCDNNSTIQISKYLVFHGKNKHINVKFHFLRDLMNDRVIRLRFCSSQDQLVDIMTKPLKLE